MEMLEAAPVAPKYRFDGDKLRLRMLAAGFVKTEELTISMAALARVVELTPEAIGQYLLGKRAPSGPNLVRIAVALRCSPLDLLTTEDEKSS